MKEQNETKAELKVETPDKNYQNFCKNTLETCIQEHRIRQLGMFNNLNFYNSNHYQLYDITSKKLIRQNRGMTVNRIKPIIRRRTNNLTKIRPKWNVVPADDSEQSVKNAVLASTLLDQAFKQLRMKAKSRQIVRHGVILKVGWMYVGWDKNKNGGKGGVELSLENPFYIFWDNTAMDLSDSRYLLRIVKRKLSEVRADPYYDKTAAANIKPQIKLGATPIFQQVMNSMQKRENTSAIDTDEDYGNCFVAELYIKETVKAEVELEKEKVDEEGKVKEKEIKKERSTTRIRKICFDVENPSNILSNKLTELEDFPLEPYYGTKDLLTPDGESIVTDMISINQGINRLKTLQVLYSERAGTSFVLPTGARVDIGNLSDGTKVYFIDGKLVKNIPNMNNAQMPQVTELLEGFERDLGEIAGDRSSAIFSGDRSGAAIENLIDLDNEDYIDDKENLEDFYSRVGYKILWNIAKYSTHIGVVSYKEEDEYKTLKYVGAETQIGSEFKEDKAELEVQNTKDSDAEDVYLVSADNKIEVTIDTELAHTMEAKINRLIQLLDAGVIDAQAVREELKFLNDIKMVERLEEREEKRAQMEAQAQAQAQMQQQMQPQQPPVPQGMPMAQGVEPPMPAEDGLAEDIALRQQLISLAESGQLPPELAQSILAQPQGMGV